MITSPDFKLINSPCYGGYDLDLGKVCEELVFDECQNSIIVHWWILKTFILYISIF